MPQISKKEISVVVQGPVSQSTKLCIESVRKFLPESFIIVSTDTSSKIDNFEIDCDKLIVSPDVGAKYSCDISDTKPNNVNRQIVSTFSGIKEVKTKYTLKLRSDFLLTGDSFLDYFDKYNNFNSEERFFEKRILACTCYTKRPRKSKFITSKGTAYPYHLSDFVHFGLSTDLYKLWDIDLASDQDLNWFNSSNSIKNEGFSRYRYTAEQQILVQFMKKNNIKYFAQYFCDRTELNAKHTDLIIANNFVLLSFENFCIEPLKDMFKPKINFSFYYTLCYLTSYTHHNWLNLYKNYCCPSIDIALLDYELPKQVLPFCFLILSGLGLSKNYQNLKTHIKNFILPSKISLNWFKEPFLVTFYLSKILIKFTSKVLSIAFKKMFS